MEIQNSYARLKAGTIVLSCQSALDEMERWSKAKLVTRAQDTLDQLISQYMKGWLYRTLFMKKDEVKLVEDYRKLATVTADIQGRLLTLPAPENSWYSNRTYVTMDEKRHEPFLTRLLRAAKTLTPETEMLVDDYSLFLLGKYSAEPKKFEV